MKQAIIVDTRAKLIKIKFTNLLYKTIMEGKS